MNSLYNIPSLFVEDYIHTKFSTNTCGLGFTSFLVFETLLPLAAGRGFVVMGVSAPTREKLVRPTRLPTRSDLRCSSGRNKTNLMHMKD